MVLATASELAACRTAMALVAAWYLSLDGGHVGFCANDNTPNLDYLRDVEAAGGTLAGRGTGMAVTRNPRQEMQHAHVRGEGFDRALGQDERAPELRCLGVAISPGRAPDVDDALIQVYVIRRELWRDHDLVFTTTVGTELDAANVRRYFRDICKGRRSSTAARRAVSWATPQSRASSRSGGKREPGLSSPDLMRDPIQSATRT